MLKLINTQKIDNITKIAIILFIICFNINFMFSFKQYQTILLLSSLLFFFINKPISSGFLIIWIMSILISKNLKKKEKFIDEPSNAKENKAKYLKEIKKYLKQNKDFEIDKEYDDFIDKLELDDDNNNNNNDIIKYIKINLEQNQFLSPKYEKSKNNNNTNEIWYFNNLENLNTNFTNYIKGDIGDYIHTEVIFKNNKNLKQIIKKKYTNYKINPIPTKTTKILNLKPLQPLQPKNTNDEKSDEPLVNKLPDDVLNIQELDKIVIDFSKVFNEVIDEITTELNTTKKPTDIKDKWTMISYIIDFIKKLFLILTKKGRMFHVGILMFCVSIVLFFI